MRRRQRVLPYWKWLDGAVWVSIALANKKTESILYFNITSSRLAGASMAEGDILLFMDSHCECYPNWLVPLLQHVACDRTSIAVPGKNSTQQIFQIHEIFLFQHRTFL